MEFKRDFYLNQLIGALHNGMIKIVTGLRRCGKTYLLFEIFRSWLEQQGVRSDHIITISLDDVRNASLREPLTLVKYVEARIEDTQQYYVIIDEVQMMKDFVDALNSMLHIKNVDCYVTGSNSRFLSKDVATEFRGRGYEIHIYPLSFAEYYEAVGGDFSGCWRAYSNYGGLPQAVKMPDGRSKIGYLKNLATTVYLTDVIERNRVQNRAELEELLRLVASAIGSPTNPTKISNTFRSVAQKTISRATITKYLAYFEDAYLIRRAMRYDVKGKKYISTLSKYYFTDIGLRNALTGFRQVEETHIMENVIYNELVARGYSVDVGIVQNRGTDSAGRMIRKTFEVDFVANRIPSRIYIQSALSIPTAEKMAQETASLQRINDNFYKVVIVRDNIEPWYNVDGVRFIGLYDFLLKPSIIETL